MQKRDYGADTQKMAGNEQIAEEVAKNANGIGYVGLAYCEKDGIKPIAVDGVELKPKNAKDYPIARSLHYYTVNGKLSEAATKFLARQPPTRRPPRSLSAWASSPLLSNLTPIRDAPPEEWCTPQFKVWLTYVGPFLF